MRLLPPRAVFGETELIERAAELGDHRQTFPLIASPTHCDAHAFAIGLPAPAESARDCSRRPVAVVDEDPPAWVRRVTATESVIAPSRATSPSPTSLVIQIRPGIPTGYRL